MKAALLIAKKEFLEISKDRKTMFFTFVLPFLLYPGLFGMMKSMAKRDRTQQESRPSRVYVADASDLLRPALAADATHFQLVEKPEGDLSKALKDDKLDLAVEVAPDAKALAEQSRTVPLSVSLNDSESASELALKRLKEALKKQDGDLVQARLKRLGAPDQLAEPTKLTEHNIADKAFSIGKAIGSFLPYLLMIMMYSGSMQHGIYATAGEKERGTLLALLATRMPRSQIILGKLLYIFSIGVIAALMNLLSMGLSMTLLSGGGLSELSGLINGATLGLTFLIMVPLGLFFANFILLGGIQAKNTLEAGTALMPGIFVVIFIGVFTMAPGVDKMAFLAYVPVVNVCLALRKLFSQQPNYAEYLMAFAMTVGFASVMTWISTRVLDREEALFKV